MRVVLLGIVLLGCHREKAAPKATVTCNVELGSDVASNHDALFKRGVSLIDPYMLIVGRTASTSPNKARDLREGIDCFDRVLAIRPENWAALWLRGKAYQAAGSHRLAVDSFAAAYQIERVNPEVGRELGLELLETGEFARAVEVDAEIVAKQPEDPGLRANLAVALLLAGDVKAAQEAVEAAAKADPNDKITADLKTVIDDVAAGKRPRPTSADELERMQ